jgi:hypothetical protein
MTEGDEVKIMQNYNYGKICLGLAAFGLLCLYIIEGGLTDGFPNAQFIFCIILTFVWLTSGIHGLVQRKILFSILGLLSGIPIFGYLLLIAFFSYVLQGFHIDPTWMIPRQN